jgi:hypothetical protein
MLNELKHPPAAVIPDKPGDYARLADYFDEALQPLFDTFKSFQHHLDAVQDDLEASGALIRIGKLLYVNRATFWPAFKQAHAMAAQQRAAALLARSNQKASAEA